MIKLSITQATCRVSKTADEHITAGMIGKVVHVDLADDWSDLVKVAVCSGSGATKDVVGWTDRFVIPSEVCKNAGSVLKIGIYGYRTLDEEVIFATPTVVANFGAIEPSLSPSGDTTTEASAEVWQQILSVAESKLADAPKDGKQYLRKDGSWEELGPDEDTASRIEAIEAKEAIWDSKAAGDHNHAGVYQPAGSYASATHNHAGVYQPVGDYANSNHTHSYNTLTDKPTIPEAYNDTALKNRVAAIESKESTWDGKQDAISDLATIRAGAAAGATALQELPEHSHTESEITVHRPGEPNSTLDQYHTYMETLLGDLYNAFDGHTHTDTEITMMDGSSTLRDVFTGFGQLFGELADKVDEIYADYLSASEVLG